MDSRLSKKFVSPLPRTSRPGPSATHDDTPTGSKRKHIDYVPDSGSESDSSVIPTTLSRGPIAAGPGKRPARPTTFGVGVDQTLEGEAERDGPRPQATQYVSPVVLGPSRLGAIARVGTVGIPLAPRIAASMATARRNDENEVEETYWMVQWRKPQQKTWDGDAILVISGNKCVMKDLDGRDIAKCAYKGGKLQSGDELRVGGKEIEIDAEISAQHYLDGSCFSRNAPPMSAPTAPAPTAYKPLRPINASIRLPVSTTSFYTAQSARPAGPQKRDEYEEQYQSAKHAGATMMKLPSESHQRKHNKKGGPVREVWINPLLSPLLRPHQHEGVKFMYECVMGMRKMEATGCILADEMGLGKTLQTIALIEMLLFRSPYPRAASHGAIGKALIVCPVSLVQNWKKEFTKWLRPGTVSVFVGDGDKAQIQQFANSKIHRVLLIGYEKLRKVIGAISTCNPPIGLIVCDEGHRLKSKDNKTTKMFDALSTKRRIILSGTPVQNDLGEYWAMANFACPLLLDTYPAFNKLFEKPILKSRTPNASAKDKELGAARLDMLNRISSDFVLRRTAGILSHYLPAKHEYVVFVAPSPLQLAIFKKLLIPTVLRMFIRGPSAQALTLINHLKKICNHPALLRATESAVPELDTAWQNALKLLPPIAKDVDVALSGKMIALARLLDLLYNKSDEKIVLVSSYTATLDILEGVCTSKRYKCLRLDGSVAQKHRQDLVDAFNRKSQKDSFVFLLSAKAGGVGLNLIGASRLVLFDSDWNPSTDLQAMARIHRDGQKRTVHIYRFLTTGTIDEKIYQRQVTKMGLSDQLMDQAQAGKADSDSFSAEELRDLFSIQLRTNGSQTHDLLECECAIEKERARREVDDSRSASPAKSGGDAADISGASDSEEDEPRFVIASQYGGTSKKRQKKEAANKQARLAALHSWDHLDPSTTGDCKEIKDNILQEILSESGTAAARHDSARAETAPRAGQEVAADGVSDSRPATPLEADLEVEEQSGPMQADLVSLKAPKHDLQALATSGQAGRILFIFEKNSGVQIKPESATGAVDAEVAGVAEDEEVSEDDESMSV